MMRCSMQILSYFTDLFVFVDQLYKSIIGVLWVALVSYGLRPGYAFLIPFTGSTPYTDLEGAILSGFYYQLSMAVILVAIVSLLVYNSLSGPRSISASFTRIASTVIFGSLSFMITTWALSGLNNIYASIYGGAGIDWYNYLLFSSSFPSPTAGSLTQSYLSIAIQFFSLTAYFISVVSLFAILMLRQALMLLCLLILPIATVLMSVNFGRKYGKIVWEIMVEMSAYPFLVLASLYLAHIFSWDAPLQLAFLFLPSILPGMLLASGRSFLSAPVLGFLGGLSMEGIAGRGMQLGNIASSAFKGGSLSNATRNALMAPLTDAKAMPGNRPGNSSSNGMPWKELLSEELKYRRE